MKAGIYGHLADHASLGDPRPRQHEAAGARRPCRVAAWRLNSLGSGQLPGPDPVRRAGGSLPHRRRGRSGGLPVCARFPRRFTEWVRTQPADRDPRCPDLTGLEVRSIPGPRRRPADLELTLPHGNGENTSERPRLAQHISPFPAARGNEQDRRERIAAWREQRSVISAHVASADRRSMIELSPRLIGSSTDPAGSQGALGHSFGAAGSAMKNAKNPSSQRPSATDSAPCRLTNPTFPWLDGSHRLRLIFTKFTVTSSYGST